MGHFSHHLLHGSVKLWDLATGAQTGAVNDMRDYNRAYPVFSPDGTILAVTASGLIEIWDISTSELMASISGGPGGVRRLLFSPDGRMLIGNDAKSNSRQIKFWDVSEWTSTSSPVEKTTDFNGDGRTNYADFFLFVDAYGGTDARFDLNGNGTVDSADFVKFVDAFGT